VCETLFDGSLGGDARALCAAPCHAETFTVILGMQNENKVVNVAGSIKLALAR
jgi:hypothetical protein